MKRLSLVALLLASVCAFTSPISAQINIIKKGFDSNGTNSNLQETTLNTSNVNSTNFGFLYALPVSGSIYAQPLYLAGVQIPGQGTHNIIIIATMNDQLYAFDADTNSAALWTRDFTNAAAGVTAIPITDIVGSNSLNIVGNVGIEGTPAIDLSTGTMYLVVRTLENGAFVARLHAVDYTTGLDKIGTGTVIQGSVPGSASDSVNNVLSFSPKLQQQRGALAIVNGVVLMTWGSHEDYQPYHGWIMAYNETTLNQVGIWCTTPNGYQGGVWMSGRAPAVDSSGNVYYQTGNGDWDGVTEFSDTFAKFSVSTSGLTLQDWFAPSDQGTDNTNDLDVGGSGPLLIPGSTDVVGGGKDAIVYLLNSLNMGHETSTDSTALQKFNIGGAAFEGPAYWNSPVGPLIYFWNSGDILRSYYFNSSANYMSQYAAGTVKSPGVPGGALSISANGSTVGSGILWANTATSASDYHGLAAGTLRANDAETLQELWNSDMVPARDTLGTLTKTPNPLVVNGKVYAATNDGLLRVYGLLGSLPQDFSITSATGKQTVTQGQTATYTINVAAQNGFTGTVALTASGLPSGATATFNPTSITGGAGSSTLQVSTAVTTPPGTYSLQVTGTSGSLINSTSVQIAVASTAPATPISIDFVGANTTAMGATESAGVVPETHWNDASGGTSTSPLALLDTNGNSTGASVSWTADNTWNNTAGDVAGNSRMMRGYLDDGAGDATIVTVSNLPVNASGYDVYVYADGANGSATRTGNYQISGAGITTTTISATDAANTDFSGTFTQANNSAGNYVHFSINATAFTITATPNSASDGVLRAPVNGIQIIPSASSSPNFTITSPTSPQTVSPGGTATYQINIGALNGFTGTVALAASGTPTGVRASFNPTYVGNGATSSSMTIPTTATTTPGTYTVTVTGTSGTIVNSTSVVLIVAGSTPATPISIKFVGTGTAMASTESAGVVPETNWNQANGAASSSAMALVDANGNSTSATVTWKADDIWSLYIADNPGNYRMMRGYLDDSAGDATVVTVAGLLASSTGYDVYVYADGANGSSARTGNYQISGTGITTSTISLTDAANTDFSGTFTQANNSAGNYVHFSISATGFTITATPSTAQDGTQRAPVNAIQVIPTASSSPNFTISSGTSTQTVTPGGTASYSLTVAAQNGFTGTVALSASGLPAGATATYTPSSITGGAGASTLQIATASTTPTGTYTVTVTGTSGTLVNSTTVQLVVSAAPNFTITSGTSTQTVAAGNTASYAITVAAQNGFTGTVALTATGLPAGATATYTPSSITGGAGASTLQIATVSTTPTGTYTVTVTGTSGTLVNSTTVQLVVSAAPNFTITSGTSSQTVTAGQTASYSVTVAAQNGFTGTVALTASGLPTAATATYTPSSITGGSGGSTLQIATSSTTPTGTYTVTVTGTSGALVNSTTVQLIVSGSTNSALPISINFVGTGTAMAATESAGVVAETNWNQATGATSGSALALVNASGASTGATATWQSENTWAEPITNTPGNYRMMLGYLDNGGGNPTSVTVSNLPASSTGYNVYVYAEGANGSATRTGIYQLSGTGITTTSITLIDAGNTSFSGAFTQANNSAGNYVEFTIGAGASGFTLTATPSTATDGTPRAPVNGIQIIPAASATPNFTVSSGTSSATVTPGQTATYPITVTSQGGFTGTVTLSASGLPAGAAATFTPASVSNGAGTSSLQISTAATTPLGTYTVTVTGTSGTLVNSGTVQLIVSSGSSSAAAISINFVGNGTAMAATESAGVVPETNWNQATGATSGSALALVNASGASTGATAIWQSDNTWAESIANTAGNYRMMLGYLDNGNGDPSTVTVSNLPASSTGYNVYVYAEGANGSASRNGIYQISGTGITTSSVTLIDAANTSFSGTFTQANNSNGNYVEFTIGAGATGFTLTATPSTTADGAPRAPVNGMQIIPH